MARTTTIRSTACRHPAFACAQYGVLVCSRWRLCSCLMRRGIESIHPMEVRVRTTYCVHTPNSFKHRPLLMDCFSNGRWRIILSTVRLSVCTQRVDASVRVTSQPCSSWNKRWYQSSRRHDPYASSDSNDSASCVLTCLGGKHGKAIVRRRTCISYVWATRSSMGKRRLFQKARVVLGRFRISSKDYSILCPTPGM